MDTLQKVKIGKGALSSCEVLTLTDCNIDAENVDDVFELGEGALPNLKTIQVGNDPKSIALAESIVEKLGGDVEIVVVGEVPTTVLPTVPSTEAPTQRPTEAPTTQPPTTEAPTTETPTTLPPTTLPPTTQVPTTQPPTMAPTEAPTTLPPTTLPPTTQPPTTLPPTETPTTLPPTTLPPTEAPTTLPPSAFNECWSEEPVSNNITSIVIDSNKCNEESVTVLDLSKYPKLKSVTIGDESFMYVNEVIITGLNELESVEIGMSSFNQHKNDYGYNPNGHFYLKNCPKLKSLKMGCYSFSDYNVFEIENVDALETIEMGELNEVSSNFYYASLELRSILIQRE